MTIALKQGTYATALTIEGRDVGNVMVQRDGEDVIHDVTFAFVRHAFHDGQRIVTK